MKWLGLAWALSLATAQGALAESMLTRSDANKAASPEAGNATPQTGDASGLKLNGSALGTILPGATSSVRGTGVPGLDGASWYIFRKPAAFIADPILRIERDDSAVAAPDIGWQPSIPYPGLYVHNKVNPASRGYTWGILNWFDNASNASTGAQNVSVAGTIVKQGWGSTYTATGASGDGKAATVTFGGGMKIPVGHTAWVQGLTPSAYNGKFKVTASSAGSVTFASTATGAMTGAGWIMDLSVGPSWASNFNCSDQTGENDPVASCIGSEIDIYSTAGTTDAHNQRVGANVAASGGETGYGIMLSTKNRAVYKRGIGFNGSYQIGSDYSSGAYTNAPIVLGANQKICFDGTSCARYLMYNGSSLIYQVPGGQAFAIGDGGTIVGNKFTNNPGSDLRLTAGSGAKTLIGAKGVESVYTYDSGGFYPTNADARTLGTASLPWSTVYGANAQLNAYTVATLPSCAAGSAGMLAYVTDANAPTYNYPLTGGSSTKTLALCNGSAWTAH